MTPMRSVPHRVVCLLGLDDGVFPRAGAIDGDDVLARRPFTGERDLRSEDRQLMLDAIMAARRHLVVTYTGANETTGQPRPPAVPLRELLDALAGRPPMPTAGRSPSTRSRPSTRTTSTPVRPSPSTRSAGRRPRRGRPAARPPPGSADELLPLRPATSSSRSWSPSSRTR